MTSPSFCPHPHWVSFRSAATPCTFVVGPGQHRRWEFMINPDEQPTEISQPEVIKKLISRWLPEGDYQLWRASAYRFHALILEQWKFDRVFFLGDAAHMKQHQVREKREWQQS
ncbi:FAD-dependent monooxygenase [Pseudomonas helleri]|uniref:FAD-dependent monooxygenase n=2 Tax=Pseudomonas TaxID=286 RepID=UPI003F947779